MTTTITLRPTGNGDAWVFFKALALHFDTETDAMAFVARRVAERPTLRWKVN